MPKVCAIKSCPSGRKSKVKTKPLSFFRATTPARLQNWRRSLGISIKSTDFICHLHFKEEHIKLYETLYIKGELKIIPTKRKSLKDEALPTIEHQFTSIPDHILQASVIHIQESFEPCDKPYPVQLVKAELLEDRESPDNINYSETKQEFEVPLTAVDSSQNNQKPIEFFKNRIKLFSMLPPFWLYSENTNGLDFMRMDPKTKRVKNHIRLNDDLTVTVIFRNDEEFPLNEKINSYDETYNYLKSVERWPLCIGTQIEDNMFSRACTGVIIGGDIYKRNRQYPRCKPCRILRNRLQNRRCSTVLENKPQ